MFRKECNFCGLSIYNQDACTECGSPNLEDPIIIGKIIDDYVPTVIKGMLTEEYGLKLSVPKLFVYLLR